MKKQNQNGITLIALIITVIVLLILAGVSISLVVGNNGVLTQASNSVVVNREAKAREVVTMAWTSATTKYWTEWAQNSSKVLKDYFTVEVLNPYVAGEGEITSVEDNQDGSWTVVYVANDQGITYTYLITEDGVITSGSQTGASGQAQGGGEPEVPPTPASVTVTVRVADGSTSYGTVYIGTAGITSGSYEEGSEVTITAEVTNQDYQFDGWYESIDSAAATQKSTDASYTYTVPNDATSVVVEARFSEKLQTFGTTSEDSGVGYYINKGTAQNPEYAIVFADRVAQQGTTVTWKIKNNSSCTFPTLTASDIAGFKTYQENGTYTDSSFGTHPVLEVVGNTSGEDRFMALSLSGLDAYCWYYSATGTTDFDATGGSDQKGTPTSKAFLAGRTNTQTMITKWNAGTNGGYGAQDKGSYKDMWGQVQTQYSNGWFVPSFEEWSAFGWALNNGKLNQDVTSFSILGPWGFYWSSSQCNGTTAWGASSRTAI